MSFLSQFIVIFIMLQCNRNVMLVDIIKLLIKKGTISNQPRHIKWALNKKKRILELKFKKNEIELKISLIFFKFSFIAK